jgi:hypothetical protein
LLGVGDDKRLGQVLGMDRSCFGAVVRGGAGWEDVADEAISVCTSHSLSFISFPFPNLQRIVFCFLSFFLSRKERGREIWFFSKMGIADERYFDLIDSQPCSPPPTSKAITTRSRAYTVAATTLSRIRV